MNTSKIILNWDEYNFAAWTPWAWTNKYIDKYYLNWTEYKIKFENWWQPWANTILYYDFEHTSWTTETNLATWQSWYNGTYSGTPTIWTLSSWKKYFNTWWNTYLETNSWFSTVNYGNCTVCVWMNVVETWAKSLFWQSWWDTPSQYWTIFCERLSNWNYQVEIWKPVWLNITGDSWWQLLIMTSDGSTLNVYRNGNTTPIASKSATAWNANSTKLYVWWAVRYWNTSPGIWNAYFGSFIVENKVWTTQEMSDYFDQTKSLYWIS